MESPEFTERQINAALKEQSPLDITVQWDGDYPEEEAAFDVYLCGENTNYFIWDRGYDLDVVESISTNVYSVIDGSRSHERIANIIIAVIEEDIEAGKLGENV